MAYTQCSGPDSHDATERMLALLRAAPDAQFAPVAEVARALFDMPIAAIRFIDGHDIWTKVASGIDPPVERREATLCHHVVTGDAVIAVDDARLDPRFAGLPSVACDGLRFYAGIPLHMRDPDSGRRHAVGVICVGDVEPRTTTPEKLAALRALGDLTDTIIASHVAADRAIDVAVVANAQAATLSRQERLFRHAERMAMIGSWRLTLSSNEVHWSAGVRRIHELDDDAVLSLEQALDFYPPHARAVVSGNLAQSLETGEPFDFEVDFVTAAGRARRVRARGEIERLGMVDIAVMGVFQDVTDRHHLEQQLRRSAATDPLTGIANRAAFDTDLDHAIDRVRSAGAPCMLVLIDLDHFKRTNDTHGHLAGDDVLCAIGERLCAPWLDGAVAARLGGDEFALLLTDREMCDRIDLIVARLAADLARPVTVQDQPLPCSATLGYAAFGPGIANARELVHAADNALYDAKHRRRGSAVRHGTDPTQRRTG